MNIEEKLSNKDIKGVGKMELKDLVGKHKLSGVDKETDLEFPDADSISFILDGKTYTAMEDVEHIYIDKYRNSSRMGEIKQTDKKVKNTFSPVDVIAILRPLKSEHILDIVDIDTARVVLSVGTGDYYEYEPYFIANFYPGNMIINQGRGNK